MSTHNVRMALWYISVFVLGATPAFAENFSGRPNILWITVEDISPFLGVYGDREAKTPNIDQLAKESVRYTHAYTIAGVCSPSRASLITGMYPTSFGAQDMRTGGSEFGKRPVPPGKPDLNDVGLPSYSAVLPVGAQPFPELLRKAGYYTTNNHKTDYQFLTPVTVWDENSPAASYRDRPAGKPFFSVYNFAITHESFIGIRQHDPQLVDVDKVPVPAIYPNTPIVRGDVARLYTNIEIMDKQVGELIKQLKQDGVYDNTIIFFFADNGGNLPWMKREITERGTHIPLIVRFPGRHQADTVDTELVSGVDFAPTVLSLAGVPIPSYMQGQAFLGDEKAKEPRDYVFGARDRMDGQYDRVRMVRDKQFRYLFNYMPDKPYYQNLKFRLRMIPMMREILTLHEQGKLPPITETWFNTKPLEELYDVEHDPWELHNLAGDPKYHQKLVELRTALQDWTSRYGDLGGLPEKDLIKRLWNGGDKPPVTDVPQVLQADGGVRLICTTAGASIGYWIEHQNGQKPAPKTVHSWDFDIYFWTKNGAEWPAQPDWKIYDGETIKLQPDDVLHVNAQRVGYMPATLDYADGKVVTKK